MEAMANIQPRLSINQLRHMFNWRVYFQVTTLSDLCNAKGDTMLETYLTYTTAAHINHLRSDRITKLKWPFQLPPTDISTFKLWVRNLKLCFLQGSSRKLNRSLGSWLVSPTKSNSIWNSYLSPDKQCLLIRTETDIRCYAKVLTSTPGTTIFAPEFSSQCLSNTIPNDFTPIDYVYSTEFCPKVFHSHRTAAILTAQVDPEVSGLLQIIAQAPQWQKHLLQHFRIHDVPFLQQCLISEDRKIYLVSDGGLYNQKGSFGVAAGTADAELYSIEGPAPGYDEHANSYRSEAYGLLAGLNFLNLLVTFYTLEIPRHRKIHMFCDNLSLVRCIQRILNDQIFPRLFIRSDSDVIVQIAHEIQLLQLAHIDIILEHVKGHQDDHREYMELSRESQLNVDADSYATNFIREGQKIAYDELPANPVNLYINEHIINRDLPNEIRKASRSPDLRLHMIIKFKWNTNTPDLVWWNIHGSTIKSFQSADRRRIRKMIFGWLPTCRRLKKYNKEICDLCPSCNTSIETNDQIFLCKCRSRIIVKNKWLESFDRFLFNERYTPYIIRMLFFNHMISFFSSEPVVMPTYIPVRIQQAINDQSSIGWTQLLFGRLAYSWGGIIEDHLTEQKVDNREMTSLIWGRRITRLLLEAGLQHWSQRNTDGHMLTQHKESSLTRTRLLQRITQFQYENHDIPYPHREFVYREMEILDS